MKLFLAKSFRLLFKINFFKKRYFGIHKKIIKPYNLFKGLVLKTRFNNLHLILHIDDWIQENIYFLGEYEKAELKAIEKFIKNDSVFIDIGANIGLYSLYMSKLIDENGKIICFEPFSKNFNALSKNISINKIENIQFEKIAIGEKEGYINLYYDEQEKNLGMVSGKSLNKGVKEKVKIISLDSYLKHEALKRIDLIKIDVEGFEYSVLLGMRNTLETFSPSLLIEILDNEDSYDLNQKCHVFLENLGYTKYFIDDGGNICKEEASPKRMNYIFTTQLLPTQNISI